MNVRRALTAISEAADSPQAVAWARFAQTLMLAAGVVLAVSVVAGTSRGGLLWVAWPITGAAMLAGVWVVVAQPAATRKARAAIDAATTRPHQDDT